MVLMKSLMNFSLMRTKPYNRAGGSGPAVVTTIFMNQPPIEFLSGFQIFFFCLIKCNLLLLFVYRALLRPLFRTLRLKLPLWQYEKSHINLSSTATRREAKSGETWRRKRIGPSKNKTHPPGGNGKGIGDPGGSAAGGKGEERRRSRANPQGTGRKKERILLE